MPMTTAYLAALRDAGQSLVTHVGLDDGTGANTLPRGTRRIRVGIPGGNDVVVSAYLS